MDLAGSGWRARVRRTPGGRLVLQVVVFVLGALFIALGLVLLVLPGPLTIPPVLLGVYLWSTEFAWAERLKVRALGVGRTTWAAARRRPVHTAAVTGGGIVLAVAAVFAADRLHVLDRVQDTLG